MHKTKHTPTSFLLRSCLRYCWSKTIQMDRWWSVSCNISEHWPVHSWRLTNKNWWPYCNLLWAFPGAHITSPRSKPFLFVVACHPTIDYFINWFHEGKVRVANEKACDPKKKRYDLTEIACQWNYVFRGRRLKVMKAYKGETNRTTRLFIKRNDSYRIIFLLFF